MATYAMSDKTAHLVLHERVLARGRGASGKQLVRGLHESDVQRRILGGHELQVPVVEFDADDEIEQLDAEVAARREEFGRDVRHETNDLHARPAPFRVAVETVTDVAGVVIVTKPIRRMVTSSPNGATSRDRSSAPNVHQS
jgi:hypothetical protein